MAQKKKTTRTRAKTKTKSRVISGKGSSLQRLQSFLRQRPVLMLAIILFGSVGTYLLVTSYALPPSGVPNDNAARGLVYRGLKPSTNPACENEFRLEHANDNSNAVCMHADPGPPGVDVRGRAQKVDKELADTAAYDAQYMTDEEGATVPEGTPSLVVNDATSGGYSLSEISGRNWTCPGTGRDGKRVKWLYIYKSGNANRLSDLRSKFVGIAKRTNAVIYNSSQASGSKAQHIRYVTNADCSLDIDGVAVTGDLSNPDNIKTQLKNKGINSEDRLYIMWIDGGSPCGMGERFADDKQGSDNLNNIGARYAWVWKGCWNYGEPHELGHMLGAVQRSAPRSTAGGHCYDEKDVMCYDDNTADSGKLSNVCTSNAKHWMMDCGFNDYYNRGTTSGYLSSHWNTAKNQFLTGN